jgi:hypothetical protein
MRFRRVLGCVAFGMGVLAVAVPARAGPASPPADDRVRALLDRVEVPTASIGVNPVRGLTGLDTWFWLIDADGALFRDAPIEAIEPRPDTLIEVQLVFAGVVWDFGDGTTTRAGIGARPPTPSPVAHRYRRTGTYALYARLVYDARYRTAGDWQDAGTVTRTVSGTYDVVQVRGLLTSARGGPGSPR